MKVIRLTYQGTEIEPSVYLLLFFRLVGIYVYERFWGTKNIQTEGLKAPDGEEIQRSPAFSAYDCELFILQSESNLQEYGILSGRQMERKVLLAKGEICPNAIDYTKFTQGKLLNAILNELMLQQIITHSEKTELDDLAAIYDANHLTKLTLKAKYFFTANEEQQLLDFQHAYDKIITDLTNYMWKSGCKWGDRKLFYTQYAAINMIYEVNCLCARYKRPQLYNRDSLLELCGALETGLDGLLGDSVKMLKGQIYDDLFFDPNSAYECYVNCCNYDKTYNSYVYYRKGSYWQEYKKDWERALKYYIQAVYFYPEYYRAWYKIGLCFNKLGRQKEAIMSYENVRKCLSNRVEGTCVRPMEIEHIFKAQIHIASIWEEKGNLRNAVEALKWAEIIWNMIGQTSFFRLMCTSPEEQFFYRTKTIENLNIHRVYERLFVLYTMVGNREEALRYRKKL